MKLQERFPIGREVVCTKTFEIGESIIFRGEVGLINMCTEDPKGVEINMPNSILILCEDDMDKFEVVP